MGVGWRSAVTGSLALVIACGDAGTTSTTDAGTSAGIDTVTGEPETDTSGSDSDTTGEPALPLCAADIDISLAIDPQAPVFDPLSWASLVVFFNDLVDAGASVRVLPNAGTEGIYATDCLLQAGGELGDPVLIWGEGGVITPGAAEALRCYLDAVEDYEFSFDYGGELDYGDQLFAGVMFPILIEDAFPRPGALGVPMLLSASDNQTYGIGGMYNRSGMASEAYLRLVAGGDRRRALAFTFGDEADRIELFGISLSPRSQHHERTDIILADALAEFTPAVLDACVALDEEPPPLEMIGCERLDLLFVIDGSGSMDEEQKALQGLDGQPPVIAEFTDALIAALGDVESFHVGVVSTEPGRAVLHTHRDFPLFDESPATDCGLPDGQRWLVGPSPTLAEDFACIAATKTTMVEVPARNAGEALADPSSAGFVRDDSLLIVVVLTDEDEQSSSVSDLQLRAQLLEAVDGDLDRLIFLSIAADQGVYEQPKTTCKGPYGHAVPGRRLASVAYSLRERGFTQDICGGSLASTFTSLLEEVISVCTPEP
ncbi:MAG: hypothetical protein R3A51_23695 [Nannocystaceae bacterium]